MITDHEGRANWCFCWEAKNKLKTSKCHEQIKHPHWSGDHEGGAIGTVGDEAVEPFRNVLRPGSHIYFGPSIYF